MTMLSTAAGKAATQSITRPYRRGKSSLTSRRIWLPKLIYNALPYFYLASGLAAFFATLYVTEWFWILPYCVLFSCVCLHLGAVVYRRRHRRTAESAYDTN